MRGVGQEVSQVAARSLIADRHTTVFKSFPFVLCVEVWLSPNQTQTRLSVATQTRVE